MHASGYIPTGIFPFSTVMAKVSTGSPAEECNMCGHKVETNHPPSLPELVLKLGGIHLEACSCYYA
eukprot:2003517-Amphidinium_carterae.1